MRTPLVTLVVLLAPFAHSQPPQTNASQIAGRPAIISPARPTDSRGETVYESQGDTQKDLPVVPGTFLPPTPLKLPSPSYSRALRKAKFTGDITIEGVVASNGDWIDLQVNGTPDPDATAAAIKAVSAYKFKPGTLDGKPVAERIRVQVSFKAFRNKADAQRQPPQYPQPAP